MALETFSKKLVWADRCSKGLEAVEGVDLVSVDFLSVEAVEEVEKNVLGVSVEFGRAEVAAKW